MVGCSKRLCDHCSTRQLGKYPVCMLHACTCSSVVLTTRMKCRLAERRHDSLLTKKHTTAFCHWIFKLWPRLCTKRPSSVPTTFYTRKRPNKHVVLDWVIGSKGFKRKQNILTAKTPFHIAELKMRVFALEFELLPVLLIIGTFASLLFANNRRTIVFLQCSRAWGNATLHLGLVKQQNSARWQQRALACLHLLMLLRNRVAGAAVSAGMHRLSCLYSPTTDATPIHISGLNIRRSHFKHCLTNTWPPVWWHVSMQTLLYKSQQRENESSPSHSLTRTHTGVPVCLH